jgi:hypothetical protein
MHMKCITCKAYLEVANKSDMLGALEGCREAGQTYSKGI